MKSKTFTLLIVSLMLIFLQTIGAFYSKSFALLSYAGLIIINVFYSFLKFTCSTEADKNLQRAQIVSIILNSLTLFILTLIIISKVSISMNIQSPTTINITNIAEIITTIVSIGFIFCSFIERQFIFIALLSLLIILGFSWHIFERIIYLDYYLSIFFTVLIMIQTILLIKKSIKMLKNKKRYSSLLFPKKLEHNIIKKL